LRREEHRREREAIAAVARDALAKIARKRGVENVADLSSIIVPGTDGRTSRLPAKRLAKFREHLTETIADAFAADPARAKKRPSTRAAPYPVTEVTAAGCATCRGRCCRTAGEHAYIEEKTIRRVRAAMPELAREEILETYLAALPAKSVRGSCVFHGTSGCTLPRTIRADICNDFFCGPLREWLDSPASKESKPTVIFVVEDRRVTRSTYVEREEEPSR